MFYVSEGEGHDRRKLQTAAILICLTAKGGDNPPSAHTPRKERAEREVEMESEGEAKKPKGTERNCDKDTKSRQRREPGAGGLRENCNI